ncbi:MAG: mechanosensitive ion channel family protein [Litorimonas sp.]
MAQDAQPAAETAITNFDFSAAGIQSLVVDKGPAIAIKLLVALLIFIVGSYIAKRVYKMLVKQADNNPRIDTTLGKLGASAAKSIIMLMTILSAVGFLGVKVAAIMSIFAAATLAIGLALEGSMANVAAGLLLLILRPYNVGDYVELNGQEGTVEDLNIFATTLCTVDNVKVILSNGEVRGATIKNLTSLGKRRVDVDFGIDYGDDMDAAIDIIKATAAKDKRLLEAPWAKVVLLNDSSVDIQMRVWCKPEDYWDVRFDLMKDVKEAFDAGGISIPYPHCVEIEKA